MKARVCPEESGGLLGGKSGFARSKPQERYKGLKKAALGLPKVLVNNVDFRRKKRATFLSGEWCKDWIVEHQGL